MSFNMAGLNIDGDLTSLNERQLHYIKNVIEKEGFTDNRIKIQPLAITGDNYVAVIKRISVDDGKGNTFKMIAKIAPQAVALRDANIIELLRNEHIMYTKVLPKLTQLEIAADVPPHERLRYAACFGSLDEAPNEIILLEDLNELNFKILNRMEPLGSDCIKSVLKNFALLHSLGFALKYKEPEVFEEFQNSLYDMWSTFSSAKDALMYFEVMITDASKLFQSEFHKKTVENCLTESIKAYAKTALPDKKSKQAVVLQGDAWTSNIMFKFEGEALLQSIMIDYQVSNVGIPVCDIIYLIFNCTDYKSRKENYYDWIDYYHNELNKALSNHGLKGNFVYSRDKLDADLKRYAKISIGQIIVIANALSLKPEEAREKKDAIEANDVEEMKKSMSLDNKDPETIMMFKKKIEESLDSFQEFGLL